MATKKTTPVADSAPLTVTELLFDLDRWMSRRAKNAQEQLDTFKRNLEANPAEAMEWAKHAMEAAAWVRVLAQLNKVRDHFRDANNPAAELREALRAADGSIKSQARNQGNSSSQARNAYAAEELGVWVRVGEELSGLVGLLDRVVA